MCRFCEIIESDKNGQIIERGSLVTAITKPYHSDNTNFLIISNEHITAGRDIDLTTEAGVKLWCEFLSFAKRLANGRDFSLKTTSGRGAGQSVDHMHVHVASNEKSWFPDIGTQWQQQKPQRPHRFIRSARGRAAWQ